VFDRDGIGQSIDASGRVETPNPKTEIPKSSGKNLNLREAMYMDIERRAGVYLSVGPEP